MRFISGRGRPWRRPRRPWFNMGRIEIVVPRANGKADFSGLTLTWLSAFKMDKMLTRGRLSIHLQEAPKLSKEWGEGQYNDADIQVSDNDAEKRIDLQLCNYMHPYFNPPAAKRRNLYDRAWAPSRLSESIAASFLYYSPLYWQFLIQRNPIEFSYLVLCLSPFFVNLFSDIPI